MKRRTYVSKQKVRHSNSVPLPLNISHPEIHAQLHIHDNSRLSKTINEQLVNTDNAIHDFIKLAKNRKINSVSSLYDEIITDPKSYDSQSLMIFNELLNRSISMLELISQIPDHDIVSYIVKFRILQFYSFLQENVFLLHHNVYPELILDLNKPPEEIKNTIKNAIGILKSDYNIFISNLSDESPVKTTSEKRRLNPISDKNNVGSILDLSHHPSPREYAVSFHVFDAPSIKSPLVTLSDVPKISSKRASRSDLLAKIKYLHGLVNNSNRVDPDDDIFQSSMPNDHLVLSQDIPTIGMDLHSDHLEMSSSNASSIQSSEINMTKEVLDH